MNPMHASSDFNSNCVLPILFNLSPYVPLSFLMKHFKANPGNHTSNLVVFIKTMYLLLGKKIFCSRGQQTTGMGLWNGCLFLKIRFC